MKKTANSDKFYKLLVSKTADTATIFMYGLIGKSEEWDSEKQAWVQTGTTDIEFVQELSKLEANYPQIHVRINSLGGSVLHGAAIVNAIRNCKSEIHTWNDGMAASMAADIWLSGKVRHMAKNAIVMIHNPMTYCFGNAAAMRECAETLEKMSEASVICMAESTGKPADEIRSKYYADANDHWLNYADCEAEGFLSSGDDYSAPTAPADDITKTAYPELLRKHLGNAEREQQRGWFKQLVDEFRATFQNPQQTQPSTHTTENLSEMKFQDFQQSLASGELDRNEVLKHLGIEQPTPLPATPTPPPASPEDDFLKKSLLDITQQVAAITEKVNAIGATPGAAKTAGGAPPQNPGEENNELADFQKRLNAYGELSVASPFS